MQFIVIILLLFFIRVPVCAEAQPKLEFMEPGAGKYMQQKLRRKYPKEDFEITILRPLTEFKVGTKYCKHGTKNWDESCQDAAMEYAFGANWPEFKRVAIGFFTAMERNDKKGMATFMTFPFDFGYIRYIDEDRGDKRFKWEILGNPEDIPYVQSGENKYVHAKYLKYETFLIGGDSIGYYIELLNTVSIRFDAECYDKKAFYDCKYFPEVSAFLE